MTGLDMYTKTFKNTLSFPGALYGRKNVLKFLNETKSDNYIFVVLCNPNPPSFVHKCAH